MLSTYDAYLKEMDPTPRPRKRWERWTESEDRNDWNLASALAFCKKNKLDPAKVRIGQNYLSWDNVETEEEVVNRITRAYSGQTRHVETIKKIHDEYQERGLYDDD